MASGKLKAAGGDRRRGGRVERQRPVKVLEPVSGRYFGGLCWDEGSAGLRLELPAWVPVAEGGTLVVGRGEGLLAAGAMVAGRVVWARRGDTVLTVGVELAAGVGLADAA